MPVSEKRRIILNAFDMFTPSHLCFGQWRRPDDTASDKFSDLSYWTSLAQTLERGDINALILADTYGQHDIYKGSAEPTIRTCCQYPMGDPAVVGLSYVEHDERYAVADEYVELLYKREHPRLSPHILAPRVAAIREKAAEFGRDPRSVKIFAVVTPIIGRTDEEAIAKYEEALKYASFEPGLAFFSGNAGIDLFKYDLDAEIKPDDAKIDGRVHSLVNSLKYRGDDIPTWTPRNIGKAMAIGGNGPVPMGSASRVADFLEEWVKVADLDGFNVGYVTSPGSFEDVVDLLVPELRRRGVYAPLGESDTMESETASKGDSVQQPEDSHVTSTRWQRVQEVIWDGPRSKDEKRLVQRLDLFVLSWATFGYFVRLLDSSNIKLSKRISIFYSASYAASMFSGYLQAAIYKGLDGASGLPGWRWLFVFCGFISIWAPLWGFFAVPDNPFITKARWMRQGEQEKHIRRMEAVDRRKPEPLTKSRVWQIFTDWPLYVFSFTLMLEKRWQVLLIPAAWAIEIMHKNMEERAVVIGIAQTLGQAFIAWVPVVVLDVGKYAPSFHMGFSIMCGVSVLELSSIFLIKHFEEREKAKEERAISAV
ncbi:pantothenate [Colletotrichum chrysophilum]|uniref:Pantothenate n=1 Tax=Colletotrichum chrysophilum TaxID=1836956 RepID=A0AAD9A5D1_9PEZI|nr:pantothenate [Colletotrichum chrysophilum]